MNQTNQLFVVDGCKKRSALSGKWHPRAKVRTAALVFSMFNMFNKFERSIHEGGRD